MKTLTVSANEFTVTIRKACIGAGVARGVADDIASGALAAASQGFVLLPPLLDALDAYDAQTADWAETASGWTTDKATALNDAPSIVDFATNGQAVSVGTFDQPVLLLACALAVPEAFAIAIGTSGWLDCADVSAQPNGPCAICLRPAKSDKSLLRPTALTVMQSDWLALESYAKNLLVPANDTTRGDAGAGNNDND